MDKKILYWVYYKVDLLDEKYSWDKVTAIVRMEFEPVTENTIAEFSKFYDEDVVMFHYHNALALSKNILIFTDGTVYDKALEDSVIHPKKLITVDKLPASMPIKILPTSRLEFSAAKVSTTLIKKYKIR